MGEILEFKPSENEKREFDKSLNQHIFTEMLIFLTELKKTDPRSYDLENIEIRKADLTKSSDEDLFTRINDSNKDDWKKHPSYYHALIAEIKSRDLI